MRRRSDLLPGQATAERDLSSRAATLPGIPQRPSVTQEAARILVVLALGLILFWGAAVGASPEPPDTANLFALEGRDCILEEAHCGIVNGRITVGIPFKRLGRVQGLWAPPYVSSDFQIIVTLGGKEIPATRFTWWPYKVVQHGSLEDIQATSTIVLVPGTRGGVLAIRNVRVRGTTMDIFVAPRQFRVKTFANEVRASLGESILVQHNGASLAVLARPPKDQED